MGDTNPVQRVTADDDLFIRMDRAAGLGVVCQVVWKLETQLDPGELERFARGLASSHFSRVLRRGRVPLARDYWVSGGAPGQTITDSDELSAERVHAWIDAAATEVRLDLVDGPAWELRSAPVHGGGMLVSLTYPHAVADGAFMMKNVRAALSDHRPEIEPLRPARLSEDLTDALGQMLRMCRSAASLAGVGVRSLRPPAVRGVPPITSQTTPFPGESNSDSDVAYVQPLVSASIPTQLWLDTAQRHGGSANSLFIAIIVGVIVGAGRADWEDTIRVSIPMTARTTDDDIRSNVTTGRSLDLRGTLSRDHDLAGIKADAKRMYTESASRVSTFTLLQTLVQGMSDGMLMRLNRKASTPLALASNMGVLDPTFTGLGSETRTGVVTMRSTTPSAGRQRMIALRGGIVAGINQSGATTTIMVTGLDPVAIPDSSALGRLVVDECARWSLQPTLW
ncbi:hypothetical protein BH683_021020 [Williamsia sp. 1138]|uniref:hypothetical protein n=1 Tax=Williamsia sp. 1138 TaxID=1903117 RepID=UPI000A1031D2|nr:hypothetical protein [Williamsia sp. 1138]OZG26929.1 hypothetical protein BH683_021020 [Williamsia sp. 1138]